MNDRSTGAVRDCAVVQLALSGALGSGSWSERWTRSECSIGRIATSIPDQRDQEIGWNTTGNPTAIATQMIVKLAIGGSGYVTVNPAAIARTRTVKLTMMFIP